MSSILKLEMSGVRSFGPDTSQSIEFKKPLTVISGQNGCGKTTIIECLKYGTTGVLPPGSRRGHSFVHDPKMSNVSEVKASVKLLFETRARQKSFVGKNLRLTQKRRKQEFQALDMVLKTRDPVTGKDVSQTSKCGEIEKLVPVLMGVSKAILENVIFCHQEDSNWPLQEGSVLKKKFDDIFESSRYTKALEALRNEKKGLTDSLKDANRDLEIHSAHLKIFEDLQRNIETHAESLKTVDTKLGTYETELNELSSSEQVLEEKIRAVKTLSEKVARYDIEIKERMRLVEMERRKCSDRALHVNSNKITISNPDTLEYVEADIKLYDNVMQSGKETISDFEQKRNQIITEKSNQSEEQRRIQNRLNSIVNEQADLDSRKRMIKKQEKIFLETLADAAIKYGLQSKDKIDPNDTEALKDCEIVLEKDLDASSPEVRGKWINKLAKSRNVITEDLSNTENEYKGIVEELDNEIMELKGQLSVIDNEEKDNDTKRKEMDFKRKSTQGKIDEMAKAQGSAGAKSAEQIEEDLKHAKFKLEQHKGDGRAEQKFEQDLRKNKEEEFALSAEIEALNRSKRKLEEQQDKVAVNAAKKQELRARTDQLKSTILSTCSGLAMSADSDEGRNLLGKIESELGDENGMNTATSAQLQESMEKCLDHATQWEYLLEEEIANKNNDVRSLEQDKRQISVERLKIKAQLDVSEQTRDKLRREADKYEESLPKLSFLNKLEDVISYEDNVGNNENSLNKANEADNRLKKNMEDLQAKFNDMNMRCHVLKKYGEVILKKGRCPVCSQGIAADLARSFDIDIDVKINEQHFHPDVNMGNVKDGKFSSSRSDTLQGLTAAAANAFYESIKKQGKLDQKEKEYMRASQEYSEFQKHKDTYVKLLELRENELPVVNKEVKELTNKDNELKAQESQLASKIQDNAYLLDVVTAQSKPCKDLVRELEQNRELATQIVAGERELGIGVSSSSTLGLDEVRESLNQKDKAREMIRQSREEIFQSLQQYKSKEQEYNRLVNEHGNKLIKFREATANLQRLTQQRMELDNDIQALNKKKREFAQKRPPVKRKYQLLLQKKEDKNTIFREKLSLLRKELEGCNRHFHRIEDIHKDIQKFNLSDLDNALAKINEKATSMKTRMKQCEEAIKKLEKEKEMQDHSLSESEKAVKELADALRVKVMDRDVRLKILKRDEKKKKIAERMGDVSNAQEQLENIRNRIDKIRMSRERQLGEKSQLSARQKSYKENLRDPKLRNIEAKYQNSIIDQNTLTLAVSDLDRYYKALDAALVQFHAIKISQINEQIRELWQLTYRGGDIDRIEIRADTDADTGKKTTKTTKARSYNYRVVMCKGSTELDMRGRCSAGQKVLASLVIRMALASTFSADCGILALDEPTTNLDVENKESLAHALAAVIKERMDESSFQLIIITHDDDFVELLRQNIQVGGASAFYAVKREPNSEGKYVSIISKVAN